MKTQPVARTEAKLNYMVPADLEHLRYAMTIGEVLRILHNVVHRMPRPVRWIAGPLTSGRRTAKENRERLHRTILHYKKNGATTLNYLPFQRRAMQIIVHEFGKKHLSQTEEIRMQERLRDEFYAPIFRQGYIGELLIMPDSYASLNVMWMRGFACAQGIPVRFIPKELVPKD